jgi:hypothetical protein
MLVKWFPSTDRVSYDRASPPSSESGKFMTKSISGIGVCFAVILLLAGCGGGGGSGGSSGPPTPGFTDPVLYSTASTASLPRADELSAVTHHQLALPGPRLITRLPQGT